MSSNDNEHKNTNNSITIDSVNEYDSDSSNTDSDKERLHVPIQIARIEKGQESIQSQSNSQITKIDDQNISNNTRHVVCNENSILNNNPYISKAINEIESVKQKLYSKIEELEKLNKPAYDTLPKQITHRNSFIFQERLRLITELNKLELSFYQEIGKLIKVAHDMMISSSKSDMTFDEQVEIMAKKDISKVRKLVR